MVFWEILKQSAGPKGEGAYCGVEKIISNKYFSLWAYTLQKIRMCDQINCLEKCFKICHIQYIWNPKVAFSFIHFVLLYFFPNECPGLCRYSQGHSVGGKIK